MKNAKNPYGDGNSSVQILDIIEQSYNNNDLSISSPDNIMTSFNVKMHNIDEDITVSDFEKKYNTTVRLLYKDDKMVFPVDDLNIKDSTVLYNDYSIK